jgi:hypothetical protein
MWCLTCGAGRNDLYDLRIMGENTMRYCTTKHQDRGKSHDNHCVGRENSCR